MLVRFENVEYPGTDLATRHTHECLRSHSQEHSLSRPRVFRCTSIVKALSTSTSHCSSCPFLSSCGSASLTYLSCRGRHAARRHASAFATPAKLICVCPVHSTCAFPSGWSVCERFQVGVLAPGLLGGVGASAGGVGGGAFPPPDEPPFIASAQAALTLCCTKNLV